MNQASMKIARFIDVSQTMRLARRADYNRAQVAHVDAILLHHTIAVALNAKYIPIGIQSRFDACTEAIRKQIPIDRTLMAANWPAKVTALTLNV